MTDEPTPFPSLNYRPSLPQVSAPHKEGTSVWKMRVKDRTKGGAYLSDQVEMVTKKEPIEERTR